jgi:hypothetical protein
MDEFYLEVNVSQWPSKILNIAHRRRPMYEIHNSAE